MDWQMIGGLGELIGAIAVVASLLYVGRQVRQSNRIARAEAYRDFVLAWTTNQLSLANDPPAAARFLETMQDHDRIVEMPPEDWASYVMRAAAALRVYEAVYRQVGEGILDSSGLSLVGGPFRSATFRKAWTLVRESYTDDFRDHVEERFRDVALSRPEDASQQHTVGLPSAT